MTAAGAAFLPYGRQSVDDEDIAAVAEVLRGDWLTTGPTVKRFEDAFAARMDVKYAVVSNSGTAALHLASMALELGPGDCAIVPSLTFLATANAVRYEGAEVVFADVDPVSGLLTADLLRQALKRTGKWRCKAVFPVHLKGSTADPAGIAAVAREHGLAVVEDACHAVGTTYSVSGVTHNVGACAHSDLAAFSLHPVKNIAMGEGGVTTTNDIRKYEAMLRGRSHGMEHNPDRWQNAEMAFEAGVPQPWYYEMPAFGYNYRAPDICCALGLSQLKKLDAFIARRKMLVTHYNRLLVDLQPVVLPPQQPQDCSPGWHLYAVQVDFEAAGVSRGEVMRRLRARGIGSQVHYIPVHAQPYYRSRYGDSLLPGAMTYYGRTLSLPLYPALTEQDVERVVAELARALELKI